MFGYLMAACGQTADDLFLILFLGGEHEVH